MRRRYKIHIADKNGDVFFLNKEVKFAKADKAVALQYHFQ